MAPQPFSRRFQGDNQVDDPDYPQSWEDKIETSDPPSRKPSPNTSLVPREATAFEISRMVTGLVTVNGNRRAANGENTERTHDSTPRFGWKLHNDTHRQKPSTRYNNPRENTQKTIGHYKPIITTLNHLTFSLQTITKSR